MWGGGALAAIVGVGILLLVTARPAQGEAVPIEGASHVGVGALPLRTSNTPPTSGDHYAQSAEPGFYEEPIDDGYLIHSLEHGYVIMWYDCDELPEQACTELKANIEATVEEFDTFKVIGVPREGMDSALALTSWGRIQELDTFDRQVVRSFIRANRGRAPEPQGH